jgi:hypothetical protein
MKVSSAKDNGAIFAIATQQRANAASQDATRNTLQRSQSITDVALAAGDTIMRVPGSNFKDGLKVAFIAPKVVKPAQAVASAPAATVADKKE